MTDLIPIERDGDRLLVDARSLHEFLNVKRDFSTWIRSRLDEVGAVENEDFTVLESSPDLGSKQRGGHNRTDYALTLDLAKEVAMLERSELGRQVRRYFIQAEKTLRERPTLTAPSYPEALRQLADAYEQRERLEAENALLSPKAGVYDALISAEGTYSVRDAAKILSTGEKRLFDLLRGRQVLMDGARSGVEHHNVPYQRFIDAGYFELITRPRPDGARVTYTPRVTAKGLAWLQRSMERQGLLPQGRPA